MRLWTPFLCAKFQGDRSTRLRFIAIFASVQKDEEKKRNFGRSYLGNGLSDFLQIWNVDSPSWRATLQQIWFQSDKLSPRYKSVKMTFSFFLSIYSRCGAPASWAARHTIVCLDYYYYQFTKKEGIHKRQSLYKVSAYKKQTYIYLQYTTN